MALKFDLGEALSQAAHAAGEMAKGASATVESAAKGVANAAEGAGNVIVDTAASASEAVGSAMCSAAEGASNAGEQIASSDAGKAIAGAANAVGGIAVGAAMGLAQGASSLASGAASTVEGGINAIKENSFSARLRKARIKGFRDGIKQGAYLAGEKRHNFIYAYVATLCFLMRCDGDFSQEEQEWLEDGLDYLKLDGGLPDGVKTKVQAIADDEDLSFDRVKDCLDNVSIVSLGSIAEQLQVAAAADGQVTEEEAHACRLFADYMAARAECVAVDESWAVRPRVRREPRAHRPGVQGADAATGRRYGLRRSRDHAPGRPRARHQLPDGGRAGGSGQCQGRRPAQLPGPRLLRLWRWGSGGIGPLVCLQEPHSLLARRAIRRDPLRGGELQDI